jgi:hypothetical protein
VASYVQSKHSYDGGATSSPIAVAFDSNVTVGNTIIVFVLHSYFGCPPSVTDSQGNTYSSKGAQPNAGGPYFWIFTAAVGSTGANTVTITFACGIVSQYAIAEASSLVADPYEDQAEGQDATSPYGAGDVTTTVDNSLILAMWNKLGSALGATSVSSPMTLAHNDTNGAFAYGVLTTAGNVNPELTGPSGTINCYTAAFQAAAGGGGGGSIAAISSGYHIRGTNR